MRLLDAILARQLPDPENASGQISLGIPSHGLDPVRAAIRDILADVVNMPAAAGLYSP